MTFHAIPALHIGKGNRWILAGPLLYYSKLYDLHIQVPKQFKTDLASIPRGFRNIININGPHRAPAIVHDWLYAVRGEMVSVRLSRADCDEIFREAMKHAGVSWLVRNIMYSAVRVGGWLSF
jgi:hypothetical protein